MMFLYDLKIHIEVTRERTIQVKSISRRRIVKKLNWREERKRREIDFLFPSPKRVNNFFNKFVSMFSFLIFHIPGYFSRY